LGWKDNCAHINPSRKRALYTLRWVMWGFKTLEDKP
jgi:hypothetical protein